LVMLDDATSASHQVLGTRTRKPYIQSQNRKAGYSNISAIKKFDV
jgi:hypothetical protein